jgi:septum formation protein
MNTLNKIYLASGSPRRLELLQNLGCRIAQVRVPFEEPNALNFKAPLDFMRFCVEQKFEQAQNFINSKKEIHNDFENGARITLVADTIVALGTKVLGKPIDKIEAFEILKKLSGKTHIVFTGYKLWITCAQVCEPVFFRTKIVESRVCFKNATNKFLLDYIRSGEPMDKAGAYGVQGMGLQLIKSIEGSYSSVMGLPLNELLKDMREAESFVASLGTLS